MLKCEMVNSMGKSDILSSLVYNKTKLAECRNTLKRLEEQYNVLDEFSGKCSSCINSFDLSMQKRKKKILGVDGFLGMVKSAVKYRQKMNDLLYGAEYNDTVASIDQLQNSIASERSKVRSNIRHVEEEIARLEAKIAKLQYEYDTYPEEVEISGQ